MSLGGSSWAQPFKYMEEGLDAANAWARLNPGSFPQVWVREGTYITNGTVPTPPVTDAERSNSFVMREGIRAYGAYVGTEGSPSTRLGSAANTILSGDNLGDSQPGALSTLDDDAYHVVAVPSYDPMDPTIGNSNWTLDAFTVEFGNANLWAPLPQW